MLVRRNESETMSMTTTEHNPFDTAAPGQSVPVAQPPVSGGVGEFASPGADLADPFAAPSTGFGKPFPRPQDLVGRVVALRKLSEGSEENPFSNKTPKELQLVYTCHLVVLSGPTVFTSDRSDDAALEAPKVEVGDPPFLVENWKVFNRGLLNKFGRNTIILGRIVREPSGKQAKDTLTTWQKVEAFVATNPSREVMDRAKLFWTLYDVEPTERDAALAWVRGGSKDAQAFMAPVS